MTRNHDGSRRRALRRGAALLLGMAGSRLAAAPLLLGMAGSRLAAAPLLLAFAGSPPAAAALPATPAQSLGPFYPRLLPDDRDNDLVRIAGRDRPAKGTVAFVAGRVSDTQGTPVAGALIEIWQCDVHGRYLRPADDGPGPRDDDFQGYGQARSDAAGAYEFRTIRPVPYSGRPPHIHFQVTHPRHPKLVTQLYARADGEGSAAGGYEAAYRALWVEFAPTTREAGAVAARFDIVLG